MRWGSETPSQWWRYSRRRRRRRPGLHWTPGLTPWKSSGRPKQRSSLHNFNENQLYKGVGKRAWRLAVGGVWPLYSRPYLLTGNVENPAFVLSNVHNRTSARDGPIFGSMGFSMHSMYTTSLIETLVCLSMHILGQVQGKVTNGDFFYINKWSWKLQNISKV